MPTTTKRPNRRPDGHIYLYLFIIHTHIYTKYMYNSMFKQDNVWGVYIVGIWYTLGWIPCVYKYMYNTLDTYAGYINNARSRIAIVFMPQRYAEATTAAALTTNAHIIALSKMAVQMVLDPFLLLSGLSLCKRNDKRFLHCVVVVVVVVVIVPKNPSDCAPATHTIFRRYIWTEIKSKGRMGAMGLCTHTYNTNTSTVQWSHRVSSVRTVGVSIYIWIPFHKWNSIRYMVVVVVVVALRRHRG